MAVSTNPQFLIGRPREKSGSIATALVGAAVVNLSYEWEEAEFPVSTMTVVQPVSVSAVRDFCDKVSKLGVTAVMVEEIETDVQHVTTFLPERSREIEGEIYKLEAEIMRSYPDVTLEFHVRVVPKDLEDAPVLPNGRYYLLTWHAA